jgi:predicted transcriptional regulator
VNAAAEFRRIQTDLAAARAKLADAIVEAARAGMKPTEIIRLSGYTREHVRRIIRQAGVAPHPDEDGEPDD